MDFVLRNDPRVALLEKTNARYLTRDALAPNVKEKIAFIAMDVSFISATLVLPAVIRAAFHNSPSDSYSDPRSLSGSREVVVLVKPQFEAGRELVGKGGIVRDEAVQQSAVARVESSLAELGAINLESIESPILGGEGNREFLLHGVFTSDF